MRRTLRTVLIGVLVFALTFNPAAAWFFGRSGCGGYSGCGWGGHRSYQSGYYGAYYGGWDHCGYSHQPVVYHGSYCGSGCYDRCGGGYCGGHCDGGNCGGYYHGGYYSDGYETYDGGVVIEGGDVMMETAPTAPAEMPNGRQTVPPPTREPSRVERPMDTTPPPQLPAEPMPPADDLFNGTEAAPTTPPPAEDADDLFGPMTEPAETTPPPAEPADDLFGPMSEPAETPPAEETPPPAEEPAPLDDLFGPMSEPADSATEDTEEIPADEAPAEETPADEDATDVDDIFGPMSRILREPGGLASVELRSWVDNTGNHSCRGRLVRFLDGKVRLLKDNGRTTTVPLYRLSKSDLEFVHRQASAERASVAGQLATSMGAVPLLAN